MSNLYPAPQQLGLEPTKPLPHPARPARPAKPVHPAKGAQSKVQMKTPWDRTVMVKKDSENDKLGQGYKFIKNVMAQPQGLNKPRMATKSAKGATASKKVSYDTFKEMKSFKEIINNLEREH